MTVTTPDDAGLRARLRRLARRTAVFAIALGATGLFAPAGATAATDAPADADEGIELFVSAGARGAVIAGGATSAVVTLQNETGDTISAARVNVELNRTPLADDASVTSWIDDGDATGTFATLASESTTPVNGDAAGTTTVSVPAEAIADLAPGVYPLRASLTGASTGNEDTDDLLSDLDPATSVLVVTTGEAAAQVGVVVPITATPVGGALLTANELSTLTADDGALTAQLDGVTGTAAILAIDPAIPAAIRVLGTAAPASATDWLTRLDELPNARFALQFGDADATAQAQAQLPALLQPTTLQSSLDPANFPSTAPTPTGDADPEGDDNGSPTPAPDTTGSPNLPDDEALLEVDGATPGILWPRSGVTQTDLGTFAAYLGGTATTILPSSVTTGRTSSHGMSGDAEVLITEAAASRALSLAAAEPDADARQRQLAAAGAHLFLSAQSMPGAPLLVGLDRGETRTPAALREAISTADTAGFSLAALRALPATPVTVAGEVDPALVPAVQELLADEQTLTAFSSILTDPQLMLSPERIRILRTLAVSIPADSFDEALARHRAATQTMLGAVSIPPSSTIQLLTAAADLPFGVRNDLPWPVNIRLTVAPSDPRLEVQSVTDAVVQPNTSMRVKVPVSARVGSGELTLRLSLSSPTGVPLADTENVRVAVRAEWEGIGLGLLGGLIALLITLGVVRTVRRRRREAIEGLAPEDAVIATPFPPESKDGRE